MAICVLTHQLRWAGRRLHWNHAAISKHPSSLLCWIYRELLTKFCGQYSRLLRWRRLWKLEAQWSGPRQYSDVAAARWGLNKLSSRRLRLGLGRSLVETLKFRCLTGNRIARPAGVGDLRVPPPLPLGGCSLRWHKMVKLYYSRISVFGLSTMYCRCLPLQVLVLPFGAL